MLFLRGKRVEARLIIAHEVRYSSNHLVIMVLVSSFWFSNDCSWSMVSISRSCGVIASVITPDEARDLCIVCPSAFTSRSFILFSCLLMVLVTVCSRALFRIFSWRWYTVRASVYSRRILELPFQLGYNRESNVSNCPSSLATTEKVMFQTKYGNKLLIIEATIFLAHQMRSCDSHHVHMSLSHPSRPIVFVLTCPFVIFHSCLWLYERCSLPL